jgi:gluconolactonase
MKIRGPLLLIAVGCVGLLIFRTLHASPGLHQTPVHLVVLGSTPLQANRLDPSADRIIPLNAQLEKIATGFTWTEGPVWLNNSLFFADITSNSIRRWTPDGRVTIFLQPSGYKGPDRYNGREPGSNGMTLDLSGSLTVAGHAQRDVYKFELLNPNATLILADTYKGKRLNSPNDLVYRADGSLYFTDPPYGLETQKDSDPKKQLTINGVYRIPQAATQKSGAPPARDSLQLLITDLPRPNGIAFSPDEKFLYVNNSEPKKIWDALSFAVGWHAHRPAPPLRRNRGSAPRFTRRHEGRSRRQHLQLWSWRPLDLLARGQAPRHHLDSGESVERRMG